MLVRSMNLINRKGLKIQNYKLVILRELNDIVEFDSLVYLENIEKIQGKPFFTISLTDVN